MIDDTVIEKPYFKTNESVYRSFNGQQLKMHRFQPYAESGYLKGVGHRVSVAKCCKRYYVTNATSFYFCIPL